MADKTYLSKEINFNETPIFWSGIEVYPGNGKSSNLYGELNVIKNPKEPSTPNINTDGNVNVKKDVNVEQDVNIEGDINILGTNSGSNGDANITGSINVDQDINIGGTAYGNFQGTINVQSWKGFDITHPNKSNHRLRHICLEGPEGGVYIRGRLTKSNVIKLPEYWKGLIDPSSITVMLTQIAYSQDLIVEKIELDQGIKIKSGNASNIDCYYVINAARNDGEPLIVEYEGQTPADYPGSKDQFSISGYDYGRTP
jgi:hypothetical protein